MTLLTADHQPASQAALRVDFVAIQMQTQGEIQPPYEASHFNPIEGSAPRLRYEVFAFPSLLLRSPCNITSDKPNQFNVFGVVKFNLI